MRNSLCWTPLSWWESVRDPFICLGNKDNITKVVLSCPSRPVLGFKSNMPHPTPTDSHFDLHCKCNVFM